MLNSKEYSKWEVVYQIVSKIKTQTHQTNGRQLPYDRPYVENKWIKPECKVINTCMTVV